MNQRIVLAKTREEVETHFQVTFDNIDLEYFPLPLFNSAHCMYIPSITMSNPSQFIFSKWGLVDGKAKQDKPTLLIPLEKVQSKKIFLKLLSENRCIIPANGIILTRKTKIGDIPYHYHLPNFPLLSLAGIYAVWETSEGSLQYTFTLISLPFTDPKTLSVSEMPAIIHPEKHSEWLNVKTNVLDAIKLLYPFSAAELNYHSVHKKILQSKANSEKLLEAFQYLIPVQTSLF